MATKSAKISGRRKDSGETAPLYEELTFGDVADLLTGEFEMLLGRGVVVSTPQDIDDEAASDLERIQKICGELLQDFEKHADEDIAVSILEDEDEDEDDDTLDEDEDDEGDLDFDEEPEEEELDD